MKSRKIALLLALIMGLSTCFALPAFAIGPMLRVGLAAPGTVYSSVSLTFDGAHSVSGKYGMKPFLNYSEPATYEARRLVGHYEISTASYNHISEVDMAQFPSGLPLVTDKGLRLINLTDRGPSGTPTWANSKIENVSLVLISEGESPKFCLFDSVNIISPESSGLFKFYNYPYRGSVGFYFETIDGIFPINTVEVEDYLYGVVPKEMPSSWHIEALKAQAVCARTYALSSLGKYADWDYDLAPTTHSQVYGGYGAEVESTNTAVYLTRGEELFYGENRVEAFFHASNGGYMAGSEDVFVTKLPYFNPKPDPYTESLGDEWELELDGPSISAYLLGEGVDIGEFQYIDNLEINPSRRVDSLRIVGTKGSHQIAGSTFRYITDIDSLYFGLSPKSSEQSIQPSLPKEVSVLTSKGSSHQSLDKLFVLGAGGKPVKLKGRKAQTATALVSLDVEEISRKNPFPWANNTKGTKIYGYGNGHGLGLSQWGAMVMAEQGKAYSEILKFYYDGVTIKK